MSAKDLLHEGVPGVAHSPRSVLGIDLLEIAEVKDTFLDDVGRVGIGVALAAGGIALVLESRDD